MDKQIRMGVIGFAHMHIEQMVDSFLARPETFLWVGCADLPPKTASLSRERGTRVINQENVSRRCDMPVFADYREVLAQKPDIVIVTCENALHPPIVCEILSEGIHVILEKPMALRYADAQQMVSTAQAHGVKLVVNWPTTWDPGFRTAHRLMREGHIGRVVKFHYRNMESLGPFSYGQQMTPEELRAEWWYQANMGGGAMADYLGYGCCLSRWFLNQRPESVFAVKETFFSHFADTEDYSAMTVRYPGAIALLEGSWATFSSGQVPAGPVLFGEKGTIVVERLGGKIFLYTQRHQKEPTIILADPLPESRENLANEMLHCLKTGELHPTLDYAVNLDTVACVDAAYRSVMSGRLEPVFL